MDYDFVSGDTGSGLIVTCADKVTALPIDLTGASVALKWVAAGILVSRTMSVVSATEGLAKYQFAGAELTAPQMDFEVEITGSAGNIISNLDLISVQVRQQLA